MCVSWCSKHIPGRACRLSRNPEATLLAAIDTTAGKRRRFEVRCEVDWVFLISADVQSREALIRGMQRVRPLDSFLFLCVCFSFVFFFALSFSFFLCPFFFSLFCSFLCVFSKHVFSFIFAFSFSFWSLPPALYSSSIIFSPSLIVPP